MPLFFLIAIGAGAFTLGATTVDVTSDTREQPRYAQTQPAAQPAGYQAQATSYGTYEDCVRTMQQHYLPVSNCQQR